MLTGRVILFAASGLFVSLSSSSSSSTAAAAEDQGFLELRLRDTEGMTFAKARMERQHTELFVALAVCKLLAIVVTKVNDFF